MNQPGENVGLRESLQALYHRLAGHIVSLRLSSYRPGAKSAGASALTKRLREFINQAPPPDEKPSSAGSEPDTPGPASQGDSRSGTASSASAAPDLAGQSTGDMSILHTTHDTAGEKLMQSAIDHLHASIRYAREGNRDAARLHATIMDSAIREAGHFLDEESYRKFVQELGEVLRDHS